jgi:hypothetical protein
VESRLESRQHVVPFPRFSSFSDQNRYLRVNISTTTRNKLLTLQARLISRPFVSLTQDARIAEDDKNRVKSKDYLLLKQRHFTAEGTEIAEKGITFS